MLKILILCVGKRKESYFFEMETEYLKRLRPYAAVSVEEVPDEKAPETLSSLQEEQVMKKEAERLLLKIKPEDYVIAMTIEGTSYTSVSFSRHICSLRDSSEKRLVFCIGGSLGLHRSVLQRANETFSLSKMTFPHRIARILLLEQLYRGFKIDAGEPYHK